MKKLILILIASLVLITGCNNKTSSNDKSLIDNNLSNKDNVIEDSEITQSDTVEEIVFKEEVEQAIKSSTKYLYEVPNKIGNNVGNLHNSGISAEQGDYIFFQGGYEGKNNLGLYRAKKDGTEIVKLAEGFSTKINVVGDWIYFGYVSVKNNAFGMHKIKIDGTELTKIYNDPYSEMIVKDDWIYFLNNKGLCRMNTDGGEFTILKEHDNNVNITNLDITDDWIYYTIVSLQRISLDGSIEQDIGHGMQYPIIDGNTIFYTTASGLSNIAKRDMLNNPTENDAEILLGDEVILAEGDNDYLNIYGDWVYFSDSGRYVYKIKKDGTDLTLISDEKRFVLLNIVEDWIYYVDYDGNKDLYKIRMDGTENQSALQQP